MKKSKRIFRVLLAMLLVFIMVMAGCGKKADSKGSTAPSSGSSTTGSSSSQSSGDSKDSNAPALHKTPISEMSFEGAVYGGTLRVGNRFSGVNNIGFPFTMATNSCWEQINACPAIETLARYNDKGELEPWLAEKWEIDPEKLTMIIKIRSGVKFHDGTDFDAEALVWNLEQSTVYGRNELDAVKEYEIVDDTTVVLHLSQWDSAIEENVLYTCGWIVSPTAVKKNGMDWACANPVGTGPFVFEKWERDVGVYYNRNENYWREGQPYLDRVEMCIYSDVTALSAALETGKIDVVIPADASVAKAWAKRGGITETGPTSSMTIHSIIFPSNNPDLPFYDVRVRKAMAHAIDTQAIAELMSEQGGDYHAITQMALPGSMSWDDTIKGYEYNPEKAKQLLKEAGYENGFTIPQYVIASNNLLKQCADIVAAYLADVGIKVENQNNDMALIAEMTAGTGKQLDGIVWFCTTVGNNCTSAYAKTFTEGANTYATITAKPDDMVKAIKDAKAARTPEEIADACKRMVRSNYENVMIIPVAVQYNGQCINNYVHNFSFVRHDPNDWYPESVWMDKH